MHAPHLFSEESPIIRHHFKPDDIFPEHLDPQLARVRSDLREAPLLGNLVARSSSPLDRTKKLVEDGDFAAAAELCRRVAREEGEVKLLEELEGERRVNYRVVNTLRKSLRARKESGFRALCDALNKNRHTNLMERSRKVPYLEYLFGRNFDLRDGADMYIADKLNCSAAATGFSLSIDDSPYAVMLLKQLLQDEEAVDRLQNLESLEVTFPTDVEGYDADVGNLSDEQKRECMAKQHGGIEFARILAASPHLKGLKNLLLEGAYIEDAGVELIANSPNLSGLNRLKLNYDVISDEGFRLLLESANLGDLRSLELRDNKISLKTSSNPEMACLDYLDLLENPFSTNRDGVEELCRLIELLGIRSFAGDIHCLDVPSRRNLGLLNVWISTQSRDDINCSFLRGCALICEHNAYEG